MTSAKRNSRAGYKYLKTYQLATVIYDLTVEFTKRWIRSWKLKEQMDGAARSGKQNIAEGYLEESLKAYIKLSGVSRASFGELLEDCEDYARQNKLAVWPLNDHRVRELREGSGMVRVGRDVDNPDAPDTPDLPENPEKAVNLMITLINQEMFLLKRQIDSLKKKHKTEGGFTEKLYWSRKKHRGY